MKTFIRQATVGVFGAMFCLAMVVSANTPQAPAGPSENRPPTVTASCKPCAVKAGEAAFLIADAKDPDGDTVTYQWAATAGSFGASSYRQVRWVAPQQAGKVTVNVTVWDGAGGSSKAELTVEVQ